MVERAVANTKNHKQIFSFDGENEDNSWTGHAHEKHDNITGPYHVSFETAIEFHERQLRVSVDAKDRAGEGREYCNLGKIHHSFGNFERATEYQKKHLNIAKELGDRASEGCAYSDLGNAFLNLGDFKRAI